MDTKAPETSVADYFTDPVEKLKPYAATRRIAPMGIVDTGRLVDRGYRDALPFQFDREIVKNALEAGASSINIQPDWIHVQDCVKAGKEAAYRYLACDDGRGMTGDELVTYFNQLSSSGPKDIPEEVDNYGIGAKISMLPWNPLGLIVMSWVDGVGSMVKIIRTPEGNYGLQKWVELDDKDKPTGALIESAPAPEDYRDFYLGQKQHGTIVLGKGSSETEDTYLGPDKKFFTNMHARALNTRFYEIPTTVDLRAYAFQSDQKSSWPTERTSATEKGGKHRRIYGAKYYLDERSASSGSVNVTGAVVHWWIAKEDLTSIHGYAEDSNYVAVLCDNELYELTAGTDARWKYQRFGILYPKAYRRITLIVEPGRWKKGRLGGVHPDNSRRTLVDSGTTDRKLPWQRWGEEFNTAMPEPIRKLCADAVASDSEPALNLRDKLKELWPRLRSPEFRRSLNGVFRVAANLVGGATRKLGSKRARSGEDGHGGAGGRGGINQSRSPDGTVRASKVNPRMDPPECEWISIANGKRTEGDLEGRAARYVQTKHLIQVNGDFPLFEQVILHWIAKHGGAPGSEEKIKVCVRDVYSLDLIAKVVHAYAMKGTPTWESQDSFDRLLSDEALTLAVLGLTGQEQQLTRMIVGAIGAAARGRPRDLSTNAEA